MATIDCIAVPTTEREIGDLAILFACLHIFHENRGILERLLITLPGDLDPKAINEDESLIRLFSIEKLFMHIDI